MRARVHVMPKAGVLDPQGAAIGMALRQLGFEGVGDVRQGKVIEVDLDVADRDAAEAVVAEMCRRLLANPVIESWRIEWA